MAAIAQPCPSDADLLSTFTSGTGLLSADTLLHATNALKSFHIAPSPTGGYDQFVEVCIALFNNSRLRFALATTFDAAFKKNEIQSKDEVKRESAVVGEQVCKALFNILVASALEQRDGDKLIAAVKSILADTFAGLRTDRGSALTTLNDPAEVWRETLLVASDTATKAGKEGIARLLTHSCKTVNPASGTDSIFNVDRVGAGSLADCMNGRHGLYNLPFNCCLVSVPSALEPDVITVQYAGGPPTAMPGVHLTTAGNPSYLTGLYRASKCGKYTWFLELFRVSSASEDAAAPPAS